MDVYSCSDEIYDSIEHPVDRAMFILFYHWGLTYKEIAYAFNLEEQDVIQQLNAMKERIESIYV